MTLTPEFRAELERDPGERLSADDAATRHESEFLNIALLKQRLRASGEPDATPGRCMNCDEQCPAMLAVYCDEQCRADHERRLSLGAREGRGRR